MSSSEFDFNILCAVADKEFKELNESEKRASLTKKISRKRHTSSDTWTFEEVKALAAKSLMGRFAEFTSDEITKRYSYKCRLMPHKCSKTESSFGNEQKAYNRMKSHLKSHLDEQHSHLGPNEFSKSPASEDKPIWLCPYQKPSKVPSKAKFVSETESSSENDSVISQDCFKSKKMLEFDYELRSTARRKQYVPKHKSVQHNAWRLPTISSLPSTIRHRREDHCQDVKSEDLKQLKKEFAQLKLNLAEKAQLKLNLASTKLDHDYLDMNPFPLTTSSMFAKPEPDAPKPVRKRRKIQKQFIIPTPVFPYLHDMEAFVVAGIVEIDIDGNLVKRKQRKETNCLDINNYLQSMPKKKSRLKMRNNIELLPICETQDVTGSVLECVENKVSKKCTGACTLKVSYFSSSDNDENSENVKRVRREQALKHITQLNSKKKKQFKGPLLCRMCNDGRQFTAVASLLHHYRGHAGIKQFGCEICQDTFTRQHSLNYHMMIHENKSRFKCEVCRRPFRHPSHFKEHMRRHTGETPFQCSFCDQLFKTRNTYKRHLRMQHNKILTAHGIADNTEEETPTCSKKLKKNPQ